MQITEYELRNRIDQLTNYRGEGTELITVAVPPGKALHAVRERVDREYAQASNIKSDQTRTHVQDALGRIRRHLQAYEETPPSGLVIYAGVVDGELQDAVFDDLDVPVDVSLYRCAAEFETAPVEQALTPSEVYGLVVLERGRAALGRLAGDRLTLADVRMFPTLVRFDHCYHTAFKCDRQYLHQYKNLWPYLRDLYQTTGVAETVRMEHIKDQGYYQGEITPIGPDIDFDAPHDRDRLSAEPSNVPSTE